MILDFVSPQVFQVQAENFLDIRASRLQYPVRSIICEAQFNGLFLLTIHQS